MGSARDRALSLIGRAGRQELRFAALKDCFEFVRLLYFVVCTYHTFSFNIPFLDSNDTFM